MPSIDPAGLSHRNELRKNPGISNKSIVFLTVGTRNTPEKYGEAFELDFVRTAKDLIKAVQDSYFIAVGPSRDHPKWSIAASETKYHIIPVGGQNDITLYHAIADVYIEGFPFGSTTALLEACLAGLSCVRAPSIVPPVFKAGSSAIDNTTCPKGVEENMRMAVQLAQRQEERARLGNHFRDAVIKIHCGDGRNSYLYNLENNIPRNHRIYPVQTIAKIPFAKRAFWDKVKLGISADKPFWFAYREAYLGGLSPRIDIRLLKAVLKAQEKCFCRRRRSLLLLGSCVLSMLPYGIGNFVYRKSMFANRKLKNICHKLTARSIGT